MGLRLILVGGEWVIFVIVIDFPMCWWLPRNCRSDGKTQDSVVLFVKGKGGGVLMRWAEKTFQLLCEC